MTIKVNKNFDYILKYDLITWSKLPTGLLIIGLQSMHENISKVIQKRFMQYIFYLYFFHTRHVPTLSEFD